MSGSQGFQAGSFRGDEPASLLPPTVPSSISAQPQFSMKSEGIAPLSRQVPVSVYLLGTGQVGSALLKRLASLDPHVRPVLAGLANSRSSVYAAGGLPPAAGLGLLQLSRTAVSASWSPLSGAGIDDGAEAAHIVVDATASDTIADRHATWLAAGVHVVSANKLGPGAAQARADAIHQARAISGAAYGIAATVGAGLPVLASIERLRRSGDSIDAVQGVLSGTLAWLLDRHDGSMSFSELVREARALGYTEPDPWLDLSGQDVLRKLLILARACGQRLDVGQVEWRPLVPAGAGNEKALDVAMSTALSTARARGQVLRYIATLDRNGQAFVGLRALAPTHPLATAGSANRVLIHTSRYRDQPLLIQGPGAGADVTAAALLDQILSITAGPGRSC